MPRTPRMAILLAAATLVLALAAAPAAQARVMAVATGSNTVVLVDLPSKTVVARLALGAPTRAVAASPDGARGYVAAGRRVVVIDLDARSVTGGVDLAGAISSLALTRDGTRLLAARRGAIDVVDTATLTVTASTSLDGAEPGPLAVSGDGTWAAVGLGRRVGLVSLTLAHLDRRKPVGEVGGVAFAPSGERVWVSTTDGVLRSLTRFSGRESAKIRLRGGAGGALALSPDGSRAAVGATRGHRTTAIVDLRRARLLARVRSGAGPGAPAYAPDAPRLYVADGAAGTVSVVSTVSSTRIGVARLGRGLHARAVAVQPAPPPDATSPSRGHGLRADGARRRVEMTPPARQARASCVGTTTDIMPLESQRTSMLPIVPIASTTPTAPSLSRLTRSPTVNPDLHMRAMVAQRHSPARVFAAGRCGAALQPM